ncbi:MULTISPECIES: hypothetical protein [unclassified Bradyrhizobium]|uniref:hypothetical protein n=1 Tax=unclassified Bradyrhizobium TaxID=2631580 RepID=UPI002479A2A2|nr:MULTISPECIES: hypothetical protein [unclassified Bradyrhizobium]WGS22185.1 hypothetical protein MTX22_11175 [Bradyrhizobium sp. ISRA463]WGS29151.1 hypothetical protein MTX19_08960 [Bradyrhizobium sp. ISRA464]
MACRIYRTLIASAGVAALIFAGATETFARSGAAARGAFAAHHPAFRHHGRVPGTFWPATVGFDYGPFEEPLVEAAPPISNDVRYTYTYDVPWDWAHRYPPAVVPSDRPYVSSCPTESVTVPGRGGDRTVNITRCY